MKTKTIKLFGKTVAVVGKRPRVSKYRFGVSSGSTFMGLHTGKVSRYLHIPMFANRTFGGVADITRT